MKRRRGALLAWAFPAGVLLAGCSEVIPSSGGSPSAEARAYASCLRAAGATIVTSPRQLAFAPTTELGTGERAAQGDITAVSGKYASLSFMPGAGSPWRIFTLARITDPADPPAAEIYRRARSAPGTIELVAYLRAGPPRSTPASMCSNVLFPKG